MKRIRIWLRGCEWPRWLANRPLHLITAAAVSPLPQGMELALGSWNGVDWISSAEYERTLWGLQQLTEQVLSRCEEIFASDSACFTMLGPELDCSVLPASI